MTDQTPFHAPTVPANLDAEQELLGAILLNNEALARVRSYLAPEDFYHAAHSAIYRAICALVDAGDLANPVTLQVYFDDDAVMKSAGGSAYLARLAASATTVYNVRDYASAIVDCSLRRRMMAAGDELRMRASTHEISVTAQEVLADHQAAVAAMANAGQRAQLTNHEVADQILHDLQNPSQPTSTGLPDLDKAMGGGLLPGRLYGFAARKKVGKTTLLASISYNLTEADVKHQFFACEANPKQVQESMIARYGGFNRMAFLPDGRDKAWVIEKTQLYRRHSKRALIWHETPGIAFPQLQSLMLAGIASGAKGTIVDYWQVVTGKSPRDSEEYHLRQVAQWLADISRKTNTWVIVAAQINQEGNTRGGEGLKLTADQYYQLHREKREPGAWLQMEETRYTRYQDIGDDTVPGLYMSSKVGPYFMAPTEWDPSHDDAEF